MITKELYGEKKCCLYANDFHLEMILLPYIKENLHEKKFVILTQNNLEETVKVLLERINLSKDEKEKIYNINWSNRREEKMEYIKKCITDSEEISVILNGSIDYMENVTKEINEFSQMQVDIIKCYSIEELNGKKIDLSDYQLLNTRKI